MPVLLVGVLAYGFGSHKNQAHLPLAPSLPPIPSADVSSFVKYQGVAPVSYGQYSVTGGDEEASVIAALQSPTRVSMIEAFHGWSINHPREGMNYFDCPEGFDYKASTRTCVMIHYSAPTESCPYGAYRDKITKHCITTDSVAPDRTCPPGFTYFMRGCIRRTQVEPMWTCSPGFSQVGSQCISVSMVPASARCPDGAYFDVNNTTCLQDILQPPSFVCTNGTSYQKTNLTLSNGNETDAIYNNVKSKVSRLNLGKNPTEGLWKKLTESKTAVLADDEEEEEIEVRYEARPMCTEKRVQTSQMCPTGYSLKPASEVLEEITKAYNKVKIPREVEDNIVLISSLSENHPTCIRVEIIRGVLSCPTGYTLSSAMGYSNHFIIGKNSESETKIAQHSSRMCIHTMRTLHEDQSRKARRETNPENWSLPEEHTLSMRLLNEVFGRKSSAAVILANKVFATHPHCSSKQDEELLWIQGDPVCVDATVMKPYISCNAGEPICRQINRDGNPYDCDNGTVVCDTTHTVSQPAAVKCPNDWLYFETPLVDQRTKLTAIAPVCRSTESIEPALNCPFDVGTPDINFQCQALSVTDLMFTCPEGYTKGTSERLKKDSQKNSKRSASPILPLDPVNKCELLEYADYQVTCPVGYQRERARNTIHACVAEKPTVPTLMCPAGFMPAVEALSLIDQKACIKTIEIAPALLSPSSPEDVMIDEPLYAKKGDYTVCSLTKNGALSCGSERKYHGETSLTLQEKWGAKYQDKYERKTAKKLDKKEREDSVR